MRKLIAAALAALAVLAGCGQTNGLQPGSTSRGSNGGIAAGLPLVATKNTTRVAGADAAAVAAGTAVAVYPSAGSPPPAVALADEHDWQAALVATELMSAPLHAPLLLSDGRNVPAATKSALAMIRPAQVIRVGQAPSPSGFRQTQISAPNPFLLAANVAAYQAASRGTPDNRVVIVSADAPQYAMAAAGWAAKSGDPILFVTAAGVPPETRDAIQRLQQPRIYVLGPASAIPAAVIAKLQPLGTVKRIGGKDPVTTAVAFARYVDSDFGWDVVNPGHGLVFANASDPINAAAGSALSGSGTYGPLLLLDSATTLPKPVRDYLLTIEPGYANDPSRGVYNHGWLIGDERAISQPVQAQIDALLEIAPVNSSAP